MIRWRLVSIFITIFSIFNFNWFRKSRVSHFLYARKRQTKPEYIFDLIVYEHFLRYTADVLPTATSMWKRIVEMHVCLSVRQSICNISCPGYYHLIWYKCCRHWNDLHWPWPGCQSQSEGQTRHLKVRVHIIVSALSPTYELKLRWGIYIYKCSSHYTSYVSVEPKNKRHSMWGNTEHIISRKQPW